MRSPTWWRLTLCLSGIVVFSCVKHQHIALWYMKQINILLLNVHFACIRRVLVTGLLFALISQSLWWICQNQGKYNNHYLSIYNLYNIITHAPVQITDFEGVAVKCLRWDDLFYYQFHVLSNSFGDVNTMHQTFVSIVIFSVHMYVCPSGERLSVACVCVCVYCSVIMCIYI